VEQGHQLILILEDLDKKYKSLRLSLSSTVTYRLAITGRASSSKIQSNIFLDSITYLYTAPLRIARSRFEESQLDWILVIKVLTPVQCCVRRDGA
jgi:hypothetical protein